MADKIIDLEDDLDPLHVSVTDDGLCRIIQGEDYVLCSREQFEAMVRFFNADGS